MRQANDADARRGATASLSVTGRWLLLAVLLLTLALPAAADGFDPRQGHRLLGAALASSAVEEVMEGAVSTPRTPEELLLMFLINPRYNAYVAKHPQVIPNLLDRITEPGFLVAVYQAALRPESYLHFIQGWTDIEKMRSYFEVLDPAVILAWARVVSDPGFYLALYQPQAEPRKLQAWLAFMAGSRLDEIVMPPLQPQTYANWLTLPFNPELMRRLQGPLRMLNPGQWPVIAGNLLLSGQQALARFAAPREDPHTDDTRLAQAGDMVLVSSRQP